MKYINKNEKFPKYRAIYLINLDHILHNINYFSKYIKKNVKIMIIAKSIFYGLGYKILKILNYCDKILYIAVAYYEEAYFLKKKKDVKIPILILYPLLIDINNIINNNFELCIYNITIFKYTIKIIKKLNIYNYPIHIKLDTGLNRLGFNNNELNYLLYKIKKNKKYIYIKSIFSHLSASNSKKYDLFTLKQINNFNKMYSFIINKIKYKPIKHILNTSGIIRFPNAHFDMVRLGIGIYGFNNYKNKLYNVISLVTYISHIKYVNKNTSIGYNRKYFIKNEKKIAIVPVGYADGINRNLGNKKFNVLINNKYLPIISDIYMDMLYIDISNVECKIGDEVIIFNNNNTIKLISYLNNTIEYETLVNISNRIKKLYIFKGKIINN